MITFFSLAVGEVTLAGITNSQEQLSEKVFHRSKSLEQQVVPVSIRFLFKNFLIKKFHHLAKLFYKPIYNLYFVPLN